MTEIDIKQLETEGRFSNGGIANFYLLLYLPLGFIVALLRTILAIVVIILGNILPDVTFTKKLLTNLFRAVFGIIVHTENDNNKDNVKVIISNFVSPLDHFVIHTATGCIMPFQTNLPSQLSYSLGLKNFGPLNNVEELKKSIGSYILENNDQILCQPEGKITNGKGVLKFKDWPFSIVDEVQPLHLKLRRPIFDISITTITSSYWGDIFWYLFSPWTVYNISFLPVEKRNDLNDSEFAESVRQVVAGGLKVEACSYGASDVLEWEKRYLLEQRRARMVHSPSNSLQSNNPEVHRMARQVKEVLPLVPYNVIFKDLVRTKNVDLTISNILEGHISYTPETTPIPSPTLSTFSISQALASTSNNFTTTTTSTTAPSATTTTIGSSNKKACYKKDTLSTAASTFPKSAQERMQSFQERKLHLIMCARQRYIDKHGITALASNSNNC